MTRVAGLADINYPVLAGAEVGRINLRPDEAHRIAQVLGVRPCDVVELRVAVRAERVGRP